MKKTIVLVCALLPALSAFAYYCDYDYGLSSHESGFSVFFVLVMIVYMVLSIVVLVRWWRMTGDVDKIRRHITHANPKLTYLVAIGEREQAQKAALTMLVDELMPIYESPYETKKAEAMNRILAAKLPKIQRLGIVLPDYVMRGERFIDYINYLSGSSVPYASQA